MTNDMRDNPLLDEVRAFCLSLPGTNERESHGAPTFFVGGKKSFVQYHNNHHGDGKIALWCAAPAGMQEMLVESEPDIYFVPAYVGYLGWIGVRLDRQAEWENIAAAIGSAYMTRAPKKLQALATGKPAE